MRENDICTLHSDEFAYGFSVSNIVSLRIMHRIAIWSGPPMCMCVCVRVDLYKYELSGTRTPTSKYFFLTVYVYIILYVHDIILFYHCIYVCIATAKSKHPAGRFQSETGVTSPVVRCSFQTSSASVNN